MNTLQTDSRGRLRHLLTLDGLDTATIAALLDRADAFVTRPGCQSGTTASFRNITVANLFFEPSTRTRASFELAVKRLGGTVLNLDISLSSAAKGESVLDTVQTLQAMNVDAFVIRHAESGVQEMVARSVMPHVAVVNAGEAHVNHPTQGLLDALTIRQHKPDFSALRIAIVGDIRHSRVARSAVHAMTALGAKDIRLIAPKSLLPGDEELAGKHFTDMDEGIRDCDVAMTLRIQKERMQAGVIPDFSEYHRLYGLDERRAELLAPDAIIMHPGPVNRGVEISAAVADEPRSVILEQVNNGVAVRMAVLEYLMELRKP